MLNFYLLTQIGNIEVLFDFSTFGNFLTVMKNMEQSVIISVKSAGSFAQWWTRKCQHFFDPRNCTVSSSAESGMLSLTPEPSVNWGQPSAVASRIGIANLVVEVR
jgi:hypothetical protein